MNTLTSICPHIPSNDPPVTKNFFCEILGFRLIADFGDYLELEKDGCPLAILRAEGTPNQQSIYLNLSGVDQIWKAHLEVLLQVEHRAPFNQEYGMRELHVVAPATETLLFIGERIATN